MNKLRKLIEEITSTHYEPLRTQEIDSVMKLFEAPTEDEVCAKLSEYFEVEVEYDSKLNMFYNEGEWGISLRDNKIDFDNLDLSPHLIVMIGRFYEGVEE